MMPFHRTVILLVLLVAALALSACGGNSSPTFADVIDQATGQGGVEESGSTAGSINRAQATVSARSLRVRGEPSPNGEVVGGIKEGEVYDVVGLSSDGQWVQLAIPAVAGGTGWVSTNYVTVQGAITEATITEAAATSAAAPSGLRLPTPTPSVQIAAAPGTATVVTEGVRLRVRSQPTANAEIVGYVYEGEVYPVVSTSADGLWTQIGGRIGTDNINGGWVSTEFLTLN